MEDIQINIDITEITTAIEKLTKTIGDCFNSYGAGLLNTGEIINVPIALNKIADSLELIADRLRRE